MALRENPLGELKVPLTWTAAVALMVAAVAAVVMLANDRRGDIQAEAYGATRRMGDAVAAPVGNVMQTPLRWVGAGVDTVRGYFFAISENRRLKAELKEARQWRDAALALRDTNERYKTLLGLRTEPPIPSIAARTVIDSRGPFANTRIANAGEEKGIKVGYPVVSENGLVGRVVGVTTGASRILMLTDIASRVPVMVDRTNARAILTGDGGPNPKMEYLRGQEPVKQGDRVVTSGDGGVLPRGLPVGLAVKGLDGRWRVSLASDAAPIDFVRILKFEDFSQLADLNELNKTPMPPAPPSGGAVGEVRQSAPAAAAASPVAAAGASRPATAAPTAPRPAPPPVSLEPQPTPPPAAAPEPPAPSSPPATPPPQ